MGRHLELLTNNSLAQHFCPDKRSRLFCHIVSAEEEKSFIVLKPEWPCESSVGPIPGSSFPDHPGPNVIKLFKAVIYKFCNKLECFSLAFTA